MKLFFIMLAIVHVVLGTDNYSHEIKPTVKWNPNGFVTLITFRLTKDWEVEVKPKRYARSVIVDSIKDGLISTKEVSVRECHYQGVVKGIPSSVVALSMCNGTQIHGEIWDGKAVYELTYYNGKQYIQRFPKGADSSSFRKSIFEWDMNVKKTAPVRFTQAFVIDHKLSHFLGHNSVDFCFSHVNIFNALLERFNAAIDLTRIVIWTDKDYINIKTNSTSEVMLAEAEQYSSNKMPGRNLVDFVTFFTVADFSTEGVSNLGSMGLPTRSTIVVYTDPNSVPINAHTTWHEFFHLVGVGHDQGSNDYLMAEKAKNRASVMLSKTNILEWNTGMVKILPRLVRKNQEWNPIATTEEHKADSNGGVPALDYTGIKVLLPCCVVLPYLIFPIL